MPWDEELDLEGAGAGALHTSKVAAFGAPGRADGARWGVVATHKQIGCIYYMHVSIFCRDQQIRATWFLILCIYI